MRNKEDLINEVIEIHKKTGLTYEQIESVMIGKRRKPPGVENE